MFNDTVRVADYAVSNSRLRMNNNVVGEKVLVLFEVISDPRKTRNNSIYDSRLSDR